MSIFVKFGVIFKLLHQKLPVSSNTFQERKTWSLHISDWGFQSSIQKHYQGSSIKDVGHSSEKVLTWPGEVGVKNPEKYQRILLTVPYSIVFDLIELNHELIS